MTTNALSLTPYRARAAADTGPMASSFPPVAQSGRGPRVLLLHDAARARDETAQLVEQVLANEHAALVAGLLPQRGTDRGAAHAVLAQSLLDMRRSLGDLAAVIAHGSACGVAAEAVRRGLPTPRLVLIEPDSSLVQADDAALAARTLVLRSRRRAGERVSSGAATGVRTVWLDSPPHSMLADPYVIATATEFALRGCLPVF